MCLEEGVDGKGPICRGRDGEELAFGVRQFPGGKLHFMGSGEGNSCSLGQEEQCENVTLVSVLR